MCFCLVEVCLQLEVVPPWQGGQSPARCSGVVCVALATRRAAVATASPSPGATWVWFVPVCLSPWLPGAAARPRTALSPATVGRGRGRPGPGKRVVPARGCLSVSGHVLCRVCATGASRAAGLPEVGPWGEGKVYPTHVGAAPSQVGEEGFGAAAPPPITNPPHTVSRCEGVAARRARASCAPGAPCRWRAAVPPPAGRAPLV